MANPNYWTYTGPVSRTTRGNIRDYVSKGVTGKTAAALDTTDSAALNRMINQVQNAWRQRYPGIKGFGQRQWTLTWTANDTRAELDANFIGLGEGGKITLLDTDGNEDTQLQVFTKEAYEQLWHGGSNRYEDRADPIAILWGISSNGQRIIEVIPTPTTAIQLRIYGQAILEVLDNDNDELEAPLEMHPGIENDCAYRFAVYKGNPRGVEFRQIADDTRSLLDNPVQDEGKRPARFLAFDEEHTRGYESFEYGD